jgi:hypothetical protein
MKLVLNFLFMGISIFLFFGPNIDFSPTTFRDLGLIGKIEMQLLGVTIEGDNGVVLPEVPRIIVALRDIQIYLLIS